MNKYKIGQMLSEIPDDFYDVSDPYTDIVYMDCEDVFIVAPNIEGAIDDFNNGDLRDYQTIESDYCGYCVNITDHGNVSLLLIHNGEIVNTIWSVV